jgi:hypothetical protein
VQFSLTLGLESQIGDPKEVVEREIERTIIKAQDQIPYEVFRFGKFTCTNFVKVDCFGYYSVIIYFEVTNDDR